MMLLTDAIDEYLLAMRYLSPHTLRWYEYKLRVFRAWAREHQLEELDQLSEHQLRSFLRDVEAAPPSGRAVSSYTLKGFAQVVKGFASWLEAEDLLARNVGKRVALPKVDKTLIKTFTSDDIARLFRACKAYRYPQRNVAIVAVLLDTGIRVNELCGLTLDHTHISPQDSYLRVLGKGRKEREVPLGQKSRMELVRYLHKERRAAPRVEQVFTGKGGQPLTERGVESLIDRLNVQAKIQGVRVSPHTFRHTFAVNYLRNGGDVYRLSRILGHASVQVTEIYLRDFQSKDAREGYRSVLDAL